MLEEHVTLEVECIDRMYLNLYVPLLQTPRGIAHYFRKDLGYDFASTALMMPMTRRFVSCIERFAEKEVIDLVTFRKKQRKEDLAKAYLRDFKLAEGVLFIGKAQEKNRTPSTRRRHNPQTGKSYPDLYMTTRIVNQYYFYCVDEDFGPFFLKFGSYFPYTGRLCINGHEYVKRQLSKRGIGYEALDNGIAWCEDPKALQLICDSLNAEKIVGLVHKWFKRLPHPFTDETQPRCGYNISMLQSEFSLTQVLDRPLSGRVFFEQVIRDNLDIGRPDRVQLIFGRRVTKRTPGQFRTRVFTNGVIPSLHVDYKNTRIKQYFKEGRALRTETTINKTKDFVVNKLVHNLPALKEVGFAANRRLLDVQRISHDSTLGEDAFAKVDQPVVVEGQRASGLRFGDSRALALLMAILLFNLLPRGFSNKDLRGRMAQLLGLAPGHFTQGKMTYDLRRLRLHGLIERIPKTHRYQVTDFGLKAALLITRTYNCVLRPGLAAANDDNPPAPTRLRKAVDRVDEEVIRLRETGRVAA
ncbi:hypothetical protein DB30_01540 [Enhygromyxa salina]|uniref:Uncharacterized protein n=1 Tax=Enhygromyxa salina TaxID=215803 RepID=A0A0C2CMA1_9BACT|nr:hypothetical protein DB30_01540 [Enhygromyxa salina]